MLMSTPGNDARTVIWTLARDLQHGHGITHIYASATPSLGVLSIATGLTVWTDGTTLRWHEGNATVTWLTADTPAAAIRLAALANRTAWGGQ
jgi:hypothetical protein